MSVDVLVMWFRLPSTAARRSTSLVCCSPKKKKKKKKKKKEKGTQNRPPNSWGSLVALESKARPIFFALGASHGAPSTTWQCVASAVHRDSVGIAPDSLRARETMQREKCNSFFWLWVKTNGTILG